MSKKQEDISLNASISHNGLDNNLNAENTSSKNKKNYVNEENKITKKNNKNDDLNKQNTNQKEKEVKVKSKAKKIWDIVAWTLTALLIAIVLFFVISLIIGFRPAVVLTGSMQPAIKPGDLIMYKTVDAETIKEGDIITFWPSADDDTEETSVTHRVIEIIPDGDGTLTFVTHGDHNTEGSNERVAQEQVIGKVSIVIPWVGRIFLFIKNNLIVVVFAIISIIILCYLLKFLYKSMKEKENNNGSVQVGTNGVVINKNSEIISKPQDNVASQDNTAEIKSLDIKNDTSKKTSKNKKNN